MRTSTDIGANEAVRPAAQGNGADVQALLSRRAPDPDFAADVEAARATPKDDNPAWVVD